MKKLPEIKFEDGQINPRTIEVIPFEVLENKLKHPINHDPYQVHRIKFNAIFLISGGKDGTHVIDFEEYSYTAGDIILVSKEQIHAFADLPQANDGISVMFTEDFFLEVGATHPFLINHLYNNQLYDPVLHLEEEKFKELHALILKINRELSHKDKSVRTEIAKSYFKVLLLELYDWRENKNGRITHNPYLKDFINFQQLLNKHIHEEKKVKFYAEQLNITTRQLNVITQSAVNVSAKDFIINMVILEAKKYLKCSHLSSKEVGYQLGFDEPTNFTKFFKKHTQLLPSEFAQSI